MPNFTDVLDQPLGEVERPKPVPAGSYLAVIQGQPNYGEVNGKDGPTKIVDLTAKLLQPQEDVNMQELADMGGLGDKSVRIRFFLTQNAAFRLDDFLWEHLGIEKGNGKTLRMALSETTGRQVGLKIKHTPSTDGKSIFSNVDSTYKI